MNRFFHIYKLIKTYDYYIIGYEFIIISHNYKISRFDLLLDADMAIFVFT